MKKFALAAALALATTSAFAGGIDTNVTPDDMGTKAASSSAGGIVVPLLVLLLVAAAASN